MLALALVAQLALLAAANGAGCAARQEGDSYVCVCNATYCDSLEREEPASGRYVQYTSSKSGLRLNKTGGELQNASQNHINHILASVTGKVVLEVNSSVTYQNVTGFGGAITDSAGINWLNLSETTRDILIQSYFGQKGIGYNLVRVPIGGCDFSTRAYAYNEAPEGDTQLSNFSLSYEDFTYKLPMIQAAIAASPASLRVLGTVWSPPVWMKTNGKISGESRLKREYYRTYALYHLKFLQEYAARGVRLWGITTTNEPVNGVIPFAQFNSLGWTPEKQTEWVVEELGPMIRSSEFADLKILAVDDQRYTVPIWLHKMVEANRTVLQYLDGVAVHYYGDFIVPAEVISWTHDHYPDLFILGTEACEGSKPWQLQKVALGSWSRAANYISDILQDLNNWVTGWIDWNLCLNLEGGPNWAGNYVDSPVIVNASADEFYKQPMFYAVAHFSKFLPPGSVRIDVQHRSLRSVDRVAFRTPAGTVVLLLYNSGLLSKTVEVVLDGRQRFDVELPAHAVATVELRQ